MPYTDLTEQGAPKYALQPSPTRLVIPYKLPQPEWVIAYSLCNLISTEDGGIVFMRANMENDPQVVQKYDDGWVQFGFQGPYELKDFVLKYAMNFIDLGLFKSIDEVEYFADTFIKEFVETENSLPKDMRNLPTFYQMVKNFFIDLKDEVPNPTEPDIEETRFSWAEECIQGLLLQQITISNIKFQAITAAKKAIEETAKDGKYIRIDRVAELPLMPPFAEKIMLQILRSTQVWWGITDHRGDSRLKMLHFTGSGFNATSSKEIRKLIEECDGVKGADPNLHWFIVEDMETAEKFANKVGTIAHIGWADLAASTVFD